MLNRQYIITVYVHKIDERKFILKFHYVIMQDDFGNTPLMTAVHQGHTNIVEILVKQEANVNYQNKVRADSYYCIIYL